MLRNHCIVKSNHVTQIGNSDGKRRQSVAVYILDICNDYICRDKRLAAQLAGLRFTNIYLDTRPLLGGCLIMYICKYTVYIPVVHRQKHAISDGRANCRGY